MVYPKCPAWGMMPKGSDFVGDTWQIAFQYGNPQGASATFANGLSNITPTQYGKCNMSRVRSYAFAQITTEAIEATQNDAGALLRGLKREIDSAFYTSANKIGIDIWGNGGGAIGQISAGSTVGTATITLANITQIVNFEVGMVLQAATTDGTSGSVESGTVTITKLNRNTGTLTASGNWSAGIGTIATGDYLFQQGDFGLCMAGIPAWVPTTDPTSTNFNGLDRTLDITRLSGVRYLTGSGNPISEILTQTAALLCREGGTPSHVFLNPLDFAAFAQAEQTRVVYDRTKSFSNPEISFSALRFITPTGPIDVIADRNVPQGGGWMLQMDTWEFKSLNAAPRILNADGLDMLRDSSTDSYILRIGWYGNLGCTAPGWNAYFAL